MHHTFQRTWIAAVLASPLWALAQTPPPANALPTGGHVTAGQVQIQQSGAAMTIQQGSARAAIDWQGFNVGSQARVDFVQPSAQSVTLNRVQGPDASQIFGRITANGQVFLSNPNGVYFAPGASVDVGGLVATTHRISLDDFMAGRTRFERQGATGSVVNEGELRAALGGYIALLAPEVRNQGVIIANLGTVALAAGEAFELQFDGNHTLAGLRVEASTIKALVDNRSAVLAPGGLVILSAQALDRVQGGVIRNSGRIEATGLAQRGGRIVLEASTQIANSGSINASATAEGPAGSVRLQAPEVVNTGSIEAKGSAEHPTGGTVEIVAGHVVQSAAARIDVSAPQLGGTVRVQASGKVELAGSISAAAAPAPSTDSAPAAAPAPAQGGEITVQAAQIELPSATLDASGGQHGGRIVLDASAPAPAAPPAPQPAPEPGKLALLGNTQLSTRGRRGQGGSVTLLGDDIGLKGHTALDATGGTGGGAVRVGGGWQGGEGLYQATTVAMDAGASIDASATQQGDGGTVVLWSDVQAQGGRTSAQGSILARGGAQGGNGGEVETSGHQLYTEGARVDTLAPLGRTGTWLLDPNNFTVAASGGNTTGAAIAANLNSTNVVIQTVATAVGDEGDIVINDNIAYTGSSERTLTFKAHNDITLNSGSSISSSAAALNTVFRARFNTAAAPDNGAVAINGNISTNGGGLWIGGGSGDALWTPYAGATAITVANSIAATWTPGVGGVSLTGATISTGAGNVYMAGQEFPSSLSAGITSHGVRIRNSSITTTTGNIDITGSVLGAFDQGLGIGIFANGANTSLQSTAGNITLTATGTDNNTAGIGWRHALLLNSQTAGHSVSIKTTSGAIALDGAATFTDARTTDTSGLQLQTDTTTSTIQVVSRTGAISLRGSNSQENGQNENAIRFSALNSPDSIRIGYDGSNAYSGNIVVQGNSLLQTNQNAGVGSIALQTTGTLTFQSAGSLFSQLRAGAGALTFDDDWNFGTTLSGFTFGKSTNTRDITLSNALSVAGGIHITGGQIALNAALTSTATGDINIIGNTGSATGVASSGSGSISKTGGGDSTLTVRSNGRVNLSGAITNTSASGKLNVVLWSDYGNTNLAGVSGTPNITTKGGHVWMGGSSTANGTTTWNGLTVGNGAAVGSAGANHNAIDLAGAIDTSNGAAGGDVYLWGGTPNAGSNSLNGTGAFTGINAGSGNITLRGNTFLWSPALNITNTGAFTLWSAAGTLNTDTGSFGQATDLSFFKFNAAPSALTWGGAANTQNVTFSPTQNATLTVAGPITVYGGNIALNNHLTSSLAGAGMLFKASGNIVAADGRVLQSNGGDITLWADSDAAGGGYIQLANNNRLDSRTAAARTANVEAGNGTSASGGGKITLGGGNGTTAADGYATSAGTTGLGGVNLGDQSNTNNVTTLYSGGGDVLIRGRQTGSSAMGVQWINGGLLNAGQGTVRIDGLNTGGGHGIELGAFRQSGELRVLAAGGDANLPAIRIQGTGADTGRGVLAQAVRLYSMGAGGINITGTAGANGPKGVDGRTVLDVLAASGPITIDGGTKGIEHVGSIGFLSTSPVTASSSNVTLTGDTVVFGAGGAAVRTTGTLTVQPFGTSFSNPFTWPVSNLVALAPSVGGLTLGKEGNTSLMTVNSAINIAGPVRIYGGYVALDNSITSTLAGAGILVKASGSIVAAANTSFTTNQGDLTLWADLNADGQGYIAMDQGVRMNTIHGATSGTGGGRLTLAGGLDTNGDGIPDGFASAASTDTTVLGSAHNPGGGVYSHAPAGVSIGFYEKTATYTNDFRFYTGGGDVLIKGRSANDTPGIAWYGGQSGAVQIIDAGTGTITLNGQSSTSHGMELSFFGGSSSPTFRSASNAPTAISVTAATTQAGNSGYQGTATFVASGTGGISISGTAKDGGKGVTGLIGAHAASGDITITGTLTGTAVGNGIQISGSLGKGSGLATSSSNIVLNADRVAFNGAESIDTTGRLTVQPISTSFTSPLTWPQANLTLSSTVSGLTLGKDVPGVAKTDTINVNAPQTIAGPIAIYGGAVNINAALTAAGDITLVSSGADADLLINVPITSTALGTSNLLLKSARNVSLAAGGSITASGGPLNTQFWADSDGTGDGIIRLLSNIDTHGGTLKFGNNVSAMINGVSTLVGGDVFINGSGAQTIATGGGQFDLFGEAILANTAGLTITTAGGDVNFHGVLNSGNTYTYVDKTGSAGSGSWNAARTEARNGSAGGAAMGDSYLATITSRLENALASLAAGYKGAWIGAHRAAPTSTYDWSWADGAEAGQHFFTQTSGGFSGSSVAGRFNNFDAAEPNGTLSGNESVAQLYGNSGRWNDLSATTTYSATQVDQVAVLGFVRETNLANSPLSINAGSGRVTIHGAVGGSKALASLNVQAASTTVNGNALITSGAQSYNNALSVVSSGDLNVSATTLTVSNAQQSALFKAAGSVTLNAGLAITTNNGDLAIWSDSDNNAEGAIVIGDSTSFNTANGATNQSSGGGRITLAGGLDDGSNGGTAGDGRADGFASSAITTGLAIGSNYAGATTTTVHSGGGDIVLRGRSTSSGSPMGVMVSRNSTLHAGNGTVQVIGSANGGHGIELGAYSGSTHITAGGGDATHAAITITGSTTAATDHAGVQTDGGSLQATGAGGVSVTGSSTGSYANGAAFLRTDVLAASGPIALTAIGNDGLRFSGTLGKKAATGVTASSSNVTLTADKLNVVGASVDTTGTLTVAPYGTSFSSPLDWPIGSLTVAPTLGGLTLGKAGNTADITLTAAQSVGGPIRIHGGNIAINAALAAVGSTITLQGSGTVSDGASGSLTAANLLLLGGNVLLDSAGTSIGTLAASGVGSLDVRNSGALVIGTVGATSGITASGPVALSTQSGDLTLAAGVSTTDTSTSAIVLNAGRAQAAGAAAGGNLVVSGSPVVTTGAGGRATLYGGSITGSTGLGALGGAGRSRYNSDETASNFSTPLGSGLYAIYREQPSVALAWGNQSVVYGTALSASGYSVTGGALHNGDAPTVVVTSGVYSGAGHLAVSATPYGVTGSGALAALGYSVTQTGGAVTVTPRTLVANYSGATRAYDGGTAVNVAASGDDRLSGDVLSVSGSGHFADANAGTGKAIVVNGGSLTGADAANYVLDTGSSSATGDITRRIVSASGAVVADKVYDGTTDATLLQPGQVATGVGSETLVLSATGADFATAGADIGKTVTVSGYALSNGTNGGLASNYQLASTTRTTTADITQAMLTVVANHDAKFITLADATGYNGVAYTGFVNGETAAVLGGSAPTISRSNASTEGAGTYTGVLVADTSGLSAANYSFQTVNGSYTIVPANQLLVRVANTSGLYGAATAHTITSAQYFNGSVPVDLTGITAHGGNSFTISDGVGGSATLTVTATGAPVSTGGWTGVGAWQLGGSNITTVNANHFNDVVTVVGSQTVDPRGLSVNTSGGISKVYDGGTAMPAITLQLSGAAAGDVLGVSAQGQFASRNAGSNIAYSVNGIALTGADAANYYVTGGTSFTGNNGSITPRTLTVSYSGVDKVYDGNTAAAFTSSDDRIANDVFSVNATATFTDKNVGAGKLVALTGAGLSGGDAGNYVLATTTGSTTADITRLDSVTWIGGATGNWFDPANWAGGAVPDLANVSNVVIPGGVVVNFDTAGIVAPAQSGPVLIDSLGGAGGGLLQTDGALNVGGGGVTLDSFTQQGGTLHSDGAIVVNDFTQTGGSTSTGGNLTVNENFAQGPNGTVAVQGDARITDTSGGTSIGNLQVGGDVAITSTDGAITQQPGTVIAVDGSATLDAGASDITLDGANNNFVGPLNATGHDITVVDGVGGLVIGNIDAAGNFDVTSTDGDITQQPGSVIVVDGSTTVDAGSGNIVLDGPYNDFTGPFNGTGNDITVVDGSGGLVIGNIDAGGDFDATSTDGDITQQPGSVIVVDGSTTVDAGSGNIVLDGPNNDFQGPFNGTGNNIKVIDGAGGLVIGNIDAGGDFDATSTDDDITQQPGSAIVVAGTTTVDAGTANIVLDGPNNDFQGPFNGTGTDITVVDGKGGLVIGNIDAAGSFVATSAGGGIAQAAGSVIAVDGDATLSAPGGTIVLAPTGNQFGGRVDLNGAGGAGGAQAPVVVPPVVPALRLPVPETAPQAMDTSGALTLMAGTTSAMAAGDGVAVRLTTAASALAPGLVSVDVPPPMVATGFSFALPQALTAGLPAGTPITATLEDGSALPAWLQFDAERRRFTASAVPAGGLPLRVLLRLGGRSVIVEMASAHAG